MVIGIGRVELLMPGNDSLKGKRRILKSIVDRVRSRFNVSVAEIDWQDEWERAMLAMVCVANDSRHVNRVLSGVMNWLESDGHALVHDYRMEIM